MSLILLSQRPISPRLERWLGEKEWLVHERQSLPDGLGYLLTAGRQSLPTIFSARRDGRQIIGRGSFWASGRWNKEALNSLPDPDQVNAPRTWATIRGHFQLFYIGVRGVQVVTDRSGCLPLYLHSSAEQGTVLSTSLLALALQLGRVRLSGQAVYEYLLSHSTYGGETLFCEARKLPPANVLNFADSRLTAYDDVETIHSAAPEELLAPLREYFSAFRDCSLPLGCELSRGYDTRTVASFLIPSGSRFSFCTNDNLEDPLDHLIPQEIAAGFGIPIRVIRRAELPAVPGDPLQRSLLFNETYRSPFGGTSAEPLFRAKAASFPLLLGGYGGELLRDKYSRFSSRTDFILRCYSNEIANLERFAPGFVDNLLAKWPGDRIGAANDYEAFYYLQRMRHWGGDRIALAAPELGYLHPLMDWELARLFLGVPTRYKAGAWLQRWLMKQFTPEIVKFPSSHGENLEPGPGPVARSDQAASRPSLVKRLVPSFVRRYRSQKRMKKITQLPVLLARKPKILPDYIPWDLRALERAGRWRAIDQYHSLDSILAFLAERGVQV